MSTILFTKTREKSRTKLHSIYWLIIVIATIIIGTTLPFLQNISLDRAALYLILALAAECVAYIGQTRPSISLNRFMYILLGLPIGFVLWYIVVLLSLNIFGGEINGDFLFSIVSLVACFGVGAIVGDLIGRLRHYKGPEQYQF